MTDKEFWRPWGYEDRTTDAGLTAFGSSFMVRRMPWGEGTITYLRAETHRGDAIEMPVTDEDIAAFVHMLLFPPDMTDESKDRFNDD